MRKANLFAEKGYEVIIVTTEQRRLQDFYKMNENIKESILIFSILILMKLSELFLFLNFDIFRGDL